MNEILFLKVIKYTYVLLFSNDNNKKSKKKKVDFSKNITIDIIYFN